MSNVDDLVGKRFGQLTVLHVFPIRPHRKWPDCTVKCDCGATKRMLVQTLRNGDAVSCGCKRRRFFTEHVRVKTHDRSHTREYDIWTGMKARCHNPQNDGFADYGGRGIVVCARWRDSFEAFLADMGPRPSPRHSIDREDNDGDYEPGNCRWATQREQARNTSRNVWLEYQGERMVVSDWAARYNLTAAVLLSRIRRGWPTERALLERPRHYGKTSTTQASEA